MDLVHEGGPWTRSKEGVHVLSSPERESQIKFVIVINTELSQTCYDRCVILIWTAGIFSIGCEYISLIISA